MESVILQGDCLEVLKTLEDESVDCCVTSPPYYGLRVYGTGTWVGGDPECNHEAAKHSTRFERTMTESSAKQTTNVGSDVKLYENVCPLCGAVREDKQIGLEDTPEQYIEKLVALFREVRRVLKNDGTLWLNIGDSYCGTGDKKDCKDPKYADGRNGQVISRNKDVIGCKHKDLIGVPWMLAFALRSDGWYLRQDIIWHKPNPMPESVRDRCTKSHEYIFLLSKEPRYYFDYKTIQEEAVTGETIRNKNEEGYQADYPNGVRFSEGDHVYGKDGKRNKRDVWSVPTKPNREAHFATYPEELITPCILAGCRVGGGSPRSLLW